MTEPQAEVISLKPESLAFARAIRKIQDDGVAECNELGAKIELIKANSMSAIEAYWIKICEAEGIDKDGYWLLLDFLDLDAAYAKKRPEAIPMFSLPDLIQDNAAKAEPEIIN